MNFNIDVFEKFIDEENTQENLTTWRKCFENSEIDFSNVGLKISFLNSLGIKYSELIRARETVDVFCRNRKELYYPAYFYNYALYVYQTECKRSSNYEYAFIKTIWVNLGNEYANQYRLLEALSCYQKAIDIDPAFDMALFNRAICKQKLSNARFYCDMFQYYNELACDLFAVDKKSLESGIEEFRNLKAKYEDIGLKMFLANPIAAKKQFTLTTSSRDTYLNWVLYNELFLNPINSLNYFNEAKSDIIIDTNLPIEILELIKEVFDYYIYLRKKLFLLRNKNDLQSKRDCVELYKSIYSIFDKIAFIIAKAFHLKIDEDKINYSSIWSDEFGLLNIKNVYLYDLYWLQQEYRPRNRLKNNDVEINNLLAPQYREFVKLRNQLEHRVEPITDYDFSFLFNKSKSLMKVIRIALLNLNWLLYDEQNPSLYLSTGERNTDLIFLPEINW